MTCYERPINNMDFDFYKRLTLAKIEARKTALNILRDKKLVEVFTKAKGKTYTKRIDTKLKETVSKYIFCQVNDWSENIFEMDISIYDKRSINSNPDKNGYCVATYYDTKFIILWGQPKDNIDIVKVRNQLASSIKKLRREIRMLNFESRHLLDLVQDYNLKTNTLRNFIDHISYETREMLGLKL